MLRSQNCVKGIIIVLHNFALFIRLPATLDMWKNADADLIPAQGARRELSGADGERIKEPWATLNCALWARMAQMPN
jgi:hypothetical protein